MRRLPSGGLAVMARGRGDEAKVKQKGWTVRATVAPR
jgi:hypothetical protein